MHRIKNFVRRLAGIFRRKKLEADMSEELRLHLEQRTREHIAAGLTPDEARYAALRKFGGVEQVKETARAQRAGAWLEQLGADFRFAGRQLFRAPCFAATVIATLGLGIGVCTVIFSTFVSVVHRASDEPEADRKVVLHETRLPRQPQLEVSVQTFLDWEERATSLEHLSASGGSSVTLRGEGEPLRLTARAVTARGFDGSYRAVLGRSFSAEDYAANRTTPPIILSHGLWQRVFGGSRDVLGRTLKLEGQLWTVVGVWAERRGRPGDDVDVWFPLVLAGDPQRNRRDQRFLAVEGRLKPGVSQAEAQIELDLLAAQVARQYPETNAGVGVVLRPWADYVNRGIASRLGILTAAVGCILILACANAANLLLARSTARQRELSVRAALGASRGRLVRQMLVESVLLAVLGGVVGVLLGHWGLQVVRAAVPNTGLDPRFAHVEMNGGILLLTLGFSIAIGIFFGSVPAWLGSRTAMSHGLKHGVRTLTEGRATGRLRSTLVTLEVALALMLIAAAGVFSRSFAQLSGHDPGFAAERTAAMKQSLSMPKYARPVARAVFSDAMTEKLLAMPSVEAAAYASQLPFNLTRPTPFTIHGATPPAPAERPTAVNSVVSPTYFATMGIGLLRGRGFTEHDNAQAPPVCVVSATFARQHFAHEDAIGRRINVDNRPDTWREIIGVVADVMQFSPRRVVTGQVYHPMAQRGYPVEFFVVRTAGRPVAVLPLFKQQLHAIDQDEVAGPARTLKEWIADRYAQDWLTSNLLAVFGGIALVLAAVGIYGVLAYSVGRRTVEIGIRMALGASQGDVMRQVLRQGMSAVLMGTVLGLLATLAFGRLIESQLFETSARDPLVLTAIICVMLGVALAACLLPAWRATRVDPMIALRAE